MEEDVERGRKPLHTRRRSAGLQAERDSVASRGVEIAGAAVDTMLRERRARGGEVGSFDHQAGEAVGRTGLRDEAQADAADPHGVVGRPLEPQLGGEQSAAPATS